MPVRTSNLAGNAVDVRIVTPSPAPTAAQMPLRLELLKARRQAMPARSSAAVAALRIRQGASKATNAKGSFCQLIVAPLRPIQHMGSSAIR